MTTTERRAYKRKRVIFGAVASAKGKPRKLDCVVRNFSEAGAFVEVADVHTLPDDITLSIARRGRQYAARVIWSREDAAGVAFTSDAPSIVPDSDLEQRLRISEKKARQLRRRVRELTGEA
jgi:hypothetical protein